jgi:hypothetical protein
MYTGGFHVFTLSPLTISNTLESKTRSEIELFENPESLSDSAAEQTSSKTDPNARDIPFNSKSSKESDQIYKSEMNRYATFLL